MTPLIISAIPALLSFSGALHRSLEVWIVNAKIIGRYCLISLALTWIA